MLVAYYGRVLCIIWCVKMSHETSPTEDTDTVENEKLREMIREEIRTAKEHGDISRRDLVKAGGLVGLTALVGGGGLAASTETAAAASGGQEEARAYLSTDTSVASSSGMQVTLDAESFDPNGNFDTTTGEYTAPSAGKYFIQWHPVLVQPNDGSKLVATIQINGGALESEQINQAGSADYLSAHAVDVRNLASGDTVAFRVFHNSPESETLSGAAKHTYATIHKLGGGSGSSAHVNPAHEPIDTPHQMPSSRPMISLEDKTYYVSRTEGSDSNGGESKSDALASLEEVGRRLPYMLFHGRKIVIMTDSSGPATDDVDQPVYWPPIWCNFVGGTSDIDIVAEGTDPDNHVIASRGLSFSIRGQEPSACYFQNLKFDCRPQNYHGIAYFDNCTFLSDTSTSQDMALGGYAGQNILHQCTFGGDVAYLSQFNQGHKFTLNQCDGTISTALVDNGGVTAPTVFLNDSPNLSFNGNYVSDTNSAGLVVHDGTLKHPSV